MDTMFKYSNFNKDISNWNVSNVENMYNMFKNSQFNGDISKWNLSKLEHKKSNIYQYDSSDDEYQYESSDDE